MDSKTVMIVDDEMEIRELFKDVLESRGYNVITCDGGYAAIDVIKDTPVFAAFVDIRMPGIDGVETLKQIKAIRPETHVVSITGFTRDEAVEDALKSGGFACMMKPFKLRDALGVLEILELGIAS